jgi:hypothetical protein
MQKRKTFSKEYNIEAVRLLETSGKPAADMAYNRGQTTNTKSIS